MGPTLFNRSPTDFIYLIFILFVLFYKPRETIQCETLFSHGTQVAMFSRKCRAGISISKTGMGRNPKRKKKKKKKKKKNIKQKNHEDCNPIKECGKKTGAEGELQELKKQAQPTHATTHSLTQRPKCQSPQFKEYMTKLTKKMAKHISLQDAGKREITKRAMC